MRLSLATAVAVAAVLAVPGVAAAKPRAGEAGTALTARHHPAPGRPGKRTAHASYFYNGVFSYCYGRTVSTGGGGYEVLSVDQTASFGFAPGTHVSWRPWVYWSNASGSGWFTPYSGYFGYTVANNWVTGGYDANGNFVIGGTAAPGVSTTTTIGIAARTAARPYLELIINGRQSWIQITPDHGDWPASRSGDFCVFA